MANNTEVKLPQLHAAVRASDEEQVLRCIQSGCNVNLRDDEGKTAIFHATYYNANVIKMLLDAGADHTVPDASNFQPLHMAARAGNLECVKLLLGAGADINTRCYRRSSWHTPLHIAVRRKYLDIVKYLVEHGADLNDDYLRHYETYECEELMDYLLTRGAPVIWEGNDEGWRVLREVVRMKNPEFTRRVIALGVNVNAIGYEDDDSDPTEENALMLALSAGTAKTVEILLENGVDLDHPLNSICRLYHYYTGCVMVKEGCVEKMEALFERGKNVNHRSEQTGQPIIVQAFEKADVEGIKLFLDYGAHITVKDKQGKSVIAHAVGMSTKDWRSRNIFEGLSPFIYYGGKIDASDVATIMSSEARPHYESFVPELENLKSHKFYLNLSLLDILVTNIYALTDYVRNKELVDAFNNALSEDGYPTYRGWLTRKFNTAYKRKEKLEPVAVFFSQVFGLNNAQHIVIRRIMSYLTDYELYRFGEALRIEEIQNKIKDLVR